MKYGFGVNYLFKLLNRGKKSAFAPYGEKLSSGKLAGVHTYVDYSVDGIFFLSQSKYLLMNLCCQK